MIGCEFIYSLALAWRGEGLVMIIPHIYVQLGVKQSIPFLCLPIMFFADDLGQTTFQKVYGVYG